jgi:hypothetical protein
MMTNLRIGWSLVEPGISLLLSRSAISLTVTFSHRVLQKLMVTQFNKIISAFSWNLKVHYHVHRSLLLSPVLKQMNILCSTQISETFPIKYFMCTDCLAGKVVWITGASSGIGEHIALALARARVKLVLSARRENELERVKQSCLSELFAHST